MEDHESEDEEPNDRDDRCIDKSKSRSGDKDTGIGEGLESCVGNTPLFRIKSLSDATGCEILAKAEFLNGGGGSPKDRVALSMIKTVYTASVAIQSIQPLSPSVSWVWASDHCKGSRQNSKVSSDPTRAIPSMKAPSAQPASPSPPYAVPAVTKPIYACPPMSRQRNPMSC